MAKLHTKNKTVCVMCVMCECVCTYHVDKNYIRLLVVFIHS